MNHTPTPRSQWPIVGDRVLSQADMSGRVLRIIPTDPLPYVLVQWSNGTIGRVSITAVRKARRLQE